MNSIKKWIVLRAKTVTFAAIIFITSSLSFATGYIANREFNHAPIIIEEQCRNEK